MEQKKIFFYIIIYLFVTLSLWHIASSLHSGEFSISKRKAIEYEVIAKNIIKNGTYSRNGVDPSGYFPPIYTLLVAAAIKLFGSSYEWPIVLFQLLITIGIGILIYKITSETFDSKLAGVIAVVIFSLHAELALAFSFDIRETGIFTFFLVLFVYFLTSKNIKRKFILASICAGISSLIRPTGVLLILILMVWIFIYSRKNKDPIISIIKKSAFPSLLVFFLIVTPWLTFESLTLNSLVLTTSTTYGQNILKGNSPATERIYPLIDVDILQVTFDNLLDKKGITGEVEREDYLKKLGITYIKNNPKNFLQISIIKFLAFYSPISTPIGHGKVFLNENKHTVIKDFKIGLINIVYFPFMIILYLGVMMMIIHRIERKTKFLSVLLITLVIFTLNHMVFFAETRFRYPLDPLIIILAAGGYYSVLNKYLKKEDRKNKERGISIE
jgi:4-amino-4-deoxy-L-arabinose transferase-like glycosyltransferase